MRALALVPRFRAAGRGDARRLSAVSPLRAGADGVWRVVDKRLALRHRLNIGTIVADASVTVQYGPAPPGRKLGDRGGAFSSRASPAATASASPESCSNSWELRDLVAYVRKASAGKATTPRWDGGRMPLSTTLAQSMLEKGRGGAGRFRGRGNAGGAADARASGPALRRADAGYSARGNPR